MCCPSEGGTQTNAKLTSLLVIKHYDKFRNIDKPQLEPSQIKIQARTEVVWEPFKPVRVRVT